MWLTWNIVVSIVGAAIQSNLIANSPFAASPSAWFWSLGLILVGVITGALARKSEK